MNITYKDIAKAIKREPRYTQVLMSRRGIKMNDVLGISRLVVEFELRGKNQKREQQKED